MAQSEMSSGPGADRRLLLLALLAMFALLSLLVARNLTLQPAGVDFLCFWNGGRVAVNEPARLYDFQYLSALQGIDASDGVVRPYINPPSALLLFAPLGLLPFKLAYLALMALSLAVLAISGVRIRAPWWQVLLPTVAFTIFCGQLSLLIAGLVVLGLSFRARPAIAGLMFAIAASIKPQLLVLLPIALAAQGQWRTILFTGAGGLLICAASAGLFGAQTWLDWFAALPRFNTIVAQQGLLDTAITPYAKLAALGLNGAWAFLLAPFVAWAVWIAFRRDAAWPARLITLLGGALLISPYAMNYELALLAPAVAAYVARTEDKRWLFYAVAAALYALNIAAGCLSLIAALVLPFLAKGLRLDDLQLTSVFFGAAGGKAATRTPSSTSALTSVGDASP
jgi:hypothetical protein